MDAKEAMLSAMKEWMLPELNSIREDYKNIKTTLDITNKRLDDMIAHLVDQGRRIDETRAELSSRIDETRAELKAEIQKNTERIDETNKRIDETNKRIDDTNNRIDDTRAELKAEIQKNTERIDYTNARIDNLAREVAEARGDLNKALSDKVVVQDLVERVGRLETRAA
ncbi:putative coiled-coil protein [Desulfonatronospira thiodismutans ASO3-1]|uniref:Coiled-coil protein n=1 Tax=Desulfonatronospira thiodismutans ASO3-1 TaxID=555779 RepID=D6SU39_9BACT|nr:coiled-coil protein [Desulfonatronospira thiodismutans]EFI32819.1 putative coiled-coil protein [Desulfonatronospira thiodismutans ASO3-1]